VHYFPILGHYYYYRRPKETGGDQIKNMKETFAKAKDDLPSYYQYPQYFQFTYLPHRKRAN